jgi:hypothetical protein
MLTSARSEIGRNQLRSSTWGQMQEKIEHQRTQQGARGKYNKAIDSALPGRHTKTSMTR